MHTRQPLSDLARSTRKPLYTEVYMWGASSGSPLGANKRDNESFGLRACGPSWVAAKCCGPEAAGHTSVRA